MEIPWATVQGEAEERPRRLPALHRPDGTWAEPSEGEAGAVEKAIGELEQTHDAVADLLLAESVHQLVVGEPGARRRRARRAGRRRGGASRAPGRAHAAHGEPDPASRRDRRARPAACVRRRLACRTLRAPSPSRASRPGLRARSAIPPSSRSHTDTTRRLPTPACPRSTSSTTPTATTPHRARSPPGCGEASATSATTSRRSLPTWELAGLLRALLASRTRARRRRRRPAGRRRRRRQDSGQRRDR